MKTNPKLPRGGTLLKQPAKKKIGGWVEMEFDAKVTRYGITWYRVKNGMSGKGDREDWVADLPAGCLSIHDSHWNGDSFGRDWKTFDGAIIGETKEQIQHEAEELLELKQNIKKVKSTLFQLNNSLRRVRAATRK